MILINEINMFNFLIKSSIEKQNDYVMIFAKYGDNDSLTTLEKKQLISSINSKYISKIIYYFFLENEYKDLEVINYLNNSDILYVMIQPPRNNFYSQNGLFLYIKNTIKKLKNKKIILVNSSSQNDVSFYFQTIKKLLKICPNIVALYENSEDSSLINLLQKHFNLDILINEKSLSFGLKNNAKGIISLTSYIFSDEFKNIFDDYIPFRKNLLLCHKPQVAHHIFYHSFLLFSYIYPYAFDYIVLD